MTAASAVGHRSFRQLRTAAIVLGLTFGATAASAAVTYVDSFPTEVSRRSLASSLSGAAGFSVLFGQVDEIGTVGGYTAYKSFVFLTTIGAIWAVLAVTRLLRGEEDGGRWALVLSGRTTPSRATAATLVGVAAGLGLVLAVTAALTLVAGARPGVGFTAAGSVVFGASSVAPGLVLGAAAAVCSQVGTTRRLATMLSMALVGIAFVVRMIGDANAGLHWVLWATPFGWAELMRPLTANDLRPVVLAVATAAGLGVAAAWLASRRDVGGGLLASTEVRDLRPFGLTSPLALATRLNAPVLAAWAAGVLATAFVFGVVAKPVADALADSPSAGDVLDELGGSGSGTLQYLGVVFLLIGAVVALLPASQIASAREEEASGRLTSVLAARPTRARWLGGRLGLAAGATLVVGLLSGLGAWAGAQSQGFDVDLGSMLGAGLNVVPAALVALSVGALALAVAPRWSTAAVYLLVAWSLVVDLLGSLVTGADRLADASLFHYVALAPAEGARATTVLAYLALAAGLTGIAFVIFGRRNLSVD